MNVNENHVYTGILDMMGECPHDPSSSEAKDWHEGYEAARTEAVRIAASQQATEPVAPPVTPKHIEEIQEMLLWPVSEDSARAARDMLQSIHFDLSMAEFGTGYVIAPDYRGYAHLGLGKYIITHSRAGDPAELVVSIATEAEKAGRTVGDLQETKPGEQIMPEAMAVRVRFENVAALGALEQQLRLLREAHFPGSPSDLADAERWRAFRNRDDFDDLDYTMFADAFREDADQIIDEAMESKP